MMARLKKYKAFEAYGASINYIRGKTFTFKPLKFLINVFQKEQEEELKKKKL